MKEVLIVFSYSNELSNEVEHAQECGWQVKDIKIVEWVNTPTIERKAHKYLIILQR